MNDHRISTIAVVGDGIAGWSAAAALARRVPNVAVALVPVADLRPGMVDLCGGAAPSIGEFHRDIGLDERDVVARTGAAFRLGTRFTGWSGADFVHAYGPAGRSIDGVSFASLWPRAGDIGAYDGFLPGAALARAGRFAPSDAGILGGHAHGLQLDMPVYRRFVEAYARHLGVRVAASGLADADIAGERVTALRLDDGGRLIADLYVDATGAEARLIGAMADEWEDWSTWLPCTALTQTCAPAEPALPPMETVEALSDGWRLTAYLPSRTEVTVVGREGEHRFAAGRRARAWIGNVVAIGEAHCVVEPMEGAPLHLLHTQIDRLIASLPDRDFADVELAYYNRETNAEADRLRDFLILPYALADRPEPFWRAARADLPPLLAETLALFRERGRLPVRDGESFDRDSWCAMLYGSGVVPRRVDALASRVDPATARAAMVAFRADLDAAVVAAPTHREYLARMRTTG